MAGHTITSSDVAVAVCLPISRWSAIITTGIIIDTHDHSRKSFDIRILPNPAIFYICYYNLEFIVIY